MATVADTIWIALGLKSDDLNKGLSKAEGDIKKTTASLSQGVNQVSAKAVSQIAGIARMVAAPLAGAMSIGAMIKSYFGGVAQVAQMTGAYSAKLEEWRKKRAMLNRVTREDIDLYKKSREALTKFQITMGDLSAKIMRQTSPAVKKLVEWLNKLSDWLDKYSDDIVRFLQVCAAVIGTALIPNLIKMAKALLMNPIAWVVAGLVALALAIDDLIVWLKGGDSAFDSFWSKFGDRKEVMAKIQKGITRIKEIGLTLWSSFREGVEFVVGGFTKLWELIRGTEIVTATLSKAVEMLTSEGFQKLLGVIGRVVGIFAALTAAAKVGSVVMGGLIKGVHALRAALTVLAAHPIILFLTLLVSIIMWVADAFERAGGDWGKVWDILLDDVADFLKIFSPIGDLFIALGEKVNEVFNSIGDAIEEWLSDKLAAAKQVWENFCEGLQTWIDKIKGWFTEIGTAIKTYFSDKIDALKATWENFCNSLQSWYNRIMGWFADIGKAIADAFSFDNITKKLDGVVAKLNPANWFKSDNAETAEAGESPKKKGWFDGMFDWADKTKENQTTELAQISKDNEVAQNAEYSTVSNNSSSSTAVYNQQRIELNNATPQAVERAFEMTGMDQSQYSQYTLQSASPIG